jgi:hypothetical protein
MTDSQHSVKFQKLWTVARQKNYIENILLYYSTLDQIALSNSWQPILQITTTYMHDDEPR